MISILLFLSKRKLTMALDDEFFQKYPIYSGVPQGSIPRNKNTI